MRHSIVRFIRCFIFSTVLLAISPVYADQNSGFLDSYPPLKPDTDRPGAMIHESAGFDRSRYSKVMISPITLFLHPKSEYQGIEPDQLKALADGFYSALVDALEPDFPVVDKPGPGVLVARLAITNIKVKKKKRGLFSYTPIGLAASAVKSSAGASIIIKDANLEVELLDSETGKQLAVLVDRSPLEDKTGQPGQSWDAIQKTLDFYASRFRNRMLKAGK